MKKDQSKKGLVIACISFFVISIALIIIGLAFRTVDDIYYYNTTPNVSYSVNLKDNDFYEEKVVGMDKQYLSGLVESIDIDFPYNYSGSSMSDIKYDYRITGTVVGEYKTTNDAKAKIWEREYVISDTKEEELKNVAGFAIDPKIKIDFPEYAKIVENFKSQNRVSIDATLYIKMDVHYVVKTNSGNIDEHQDVEILIPLTSSTFNINSNFELVKKQIGGDVHVERIYILAGIVSAVLSLIMFEILFFRFMYKPKRRYDIELNKILSEYADIIAEVSDPIEFDDERIFELSDFNDLVDVEAEVKSPILFYEISNGKHPRSTFVVLKDDKAFRFILRG